MGNNEDEESYLSDMDRRERLSHADQHRVIYSEFDHMHKDVRSKNLIEMFYEYQAVESFIAENLYGGVGESLPNYIEPYKGLKYFDLDKMAYMTPQSHKMSSRSDESKLLTPFEVYITLLKGYCVILVLILPRAFVTGGYITTALLLVLSGVIGTITASLLVKSGLKAGISSYSELTGQVLGSKMRVVIDLCISMAQFSFTVSHIAFIIESLQTTVEVQTGLETPQWPYFVVICLILTLISWVEDIKRFSVTFLIGNLLIFGTIVSVSTYCIYLLRD